MAHAGLISDDHPLQAAPGTAAGTSSSSSATTASCSAATQAVCIHTLLQCTSSGHTSNILPIAATASATTVATNPRPSATSELALLRLQHIRIEHFRLV